MSRLERTMFVEAAAQIASWRKPLLISHTKPDGDALGSLIAMRALLGSQGIDATALLFGPIPDRYSIFHCYHAMPVYGNEVREADLADFNGIIVLDTCAYNQLRPIADWLQSAAVPKLAVDHHVTRDELVDQYLIDESAAATCLILYDWARALDWPMTDDTCEALFIGMAMDTGWFQHANTDDRVLAAAADLVTRGVQPHELHQALFQRETPARVRLLGAALRTLELSAADRLAVMTLSADAVTDCGATSADTEDIVNEPLRISSVAVSVLLVEQTDDVIRASFRSKPPLDWKKPPPLPHPRRGKERPTQRRTDVNVAKVAGAFGGGGHTRAAGARIHGTLSDVRNTVIERLESILSG